MPVNHSHEHARWPKKRSYAASRPVVPRTRTSLADWRRYTSTYTAGPALWNAWNCLRNNFPLVNQTKLECVAMPSVMAARCVGRNSGPILPFVHYSWPGPGPSRENKGGSFPGPHDVWGPRHRSKMLKRVFHMASFWLEICIKSIFDLGSAPDPAGGAYDTPQTPSRMLRGHPSPIKLSRHGMRLW